MYTIRTTNQFEKDLKRYKKRGLNINILEEGIQLLAESGTLPVNINHIN
jgi:mRNA-degrading endonuclease YafQ of YafQ-DinJ toxin-antitoxin module